MKPKPLSSLNHLTVPTAIGLPPFAVCRVRRDPRNGRRALTPICGATAAPPVLGTLAGTGRLTSLARVLSSTAPLRASVERAFPERPFAVQFWDGSEIPATTAPAPTFVLRSPKACAHVLRAPGELGVGRA